MNLNEVTAYEVIQKKKLTDIRSTGYLLRHIKTGARVMLIENDDENKVFNIAFRTPPKNSTGVAHILEHSVLCGSREFPLKDPFVELVKGSLNTFLNAMTYPGQNLLPGGKLQRSGFPEPEACLPGRVFTRIFTRKKRSSARKDGATIWNSRKDH